MSYPLTYWKTLKRGYKFLEPTFYSAHHLGLDIICPIGTQLIAWDDCTVKSVFGKQGGNQAHVYTDGKLFRFLHLDKPCKTGKMKAGDVIGKTGNTGMSTGPHTHCDISKNGKLELTNTKNFIDPEQYFKDINKKPEKVDIQVTTSTVPVTPKIEARELLGVDVPESIIETIKYDQKPVESSTIELAKIEIPKSLVVRLLELIKQLLKL